MAELFKNHRQELEELTASGPHFLYDLDSLKAHINYVASFEKKVAGLKFWYATKANPLSNIITTITENGFRLDVASIGELEQAERCGVPGERTLMTGPAKSEEFLRKGFERGVAVYVVESPKQLRDIQRLAKLYKQTPKLLLRVQLKWQENDRSVLGGNQITPFGMDVETVKRLMPEISLPLLGFHTFQWGNILSVKRLEKIWDYTIKSCKEITADFKVIDVGGGLGVPYNGEESIAWEEVAAAIEVVKSKYNIEEFWLELGRYAMGEHGYYLNKIIDIKETYGRKLVVLEGGINHIVRPALLNQQFPAFLLRNSLANQENYYLHGPLCTAQDCLGNYLLPSDLKPGDVIVFKQAGAYAHTLSMPYFLCHNLAGELVLQHGKISQVRGPKKATEWLR